MLADDDDSMGMCAEPFGDDYGSIALRSRLEVMSIDREALKKRISELEAENERLKTLLDRKKNTVGKDRKFTLVQIVDYCKGCVEWNDAKEIVRMLNKLLRHIGTEEDSELVDGIETEFRNRVYGNTFNNHITGVIDNLTINE